MHEAADGDFGNMVASLPIAVDTGKRDRLLRTAMPPRQKHKHEGVGMHI